MSDGLTEVFDQGDGELGLEGVTEAFAAHGGGPLPAVADALMDRARRHGVQLDDQSVLLVRRV